MILLSISSNLGKKLMTTNKKQDLEMIRKLLSIFSTIPDQIDSIMHEFLPNIWSRKTQIFNNLIKGMMIKLRKFLINGNIVIDLGILRHFFSSLSSCGKTIHLSKLFLKKKKVKKEHSIMAGYILGNGINKLRICVNLIV